MRTIRITLPTLTGGYRLQKGMPHSTCNWKKMVTILKLKSNMKRLPEKRNGMASCYRVHPVAGKIQ